MSEEDKQKIEDAKTCDNCLCWHKYCKAECCKMIFINISLGEFQRQMETAEPYLIFNKPLLPNDRWYFKLHNVSYLHGIMKFKKERCTIIDGRVVYVYKCDLLDEDMKCKAHPDNKPNICKALTLESSKKSNKRFEVSKHCLFRYKNLEVGVNDEKISQTGKD